MRHKAVTRRLKNYVFPGFANRATLDTTKTTRVLTIMHASEY